MTGTNLFVKGSAAFSPCMRYRYSLHRIWGHGKMLAMICLNPSTATADLDDPTVARQVTRAQKLGYERFKMLNIFAYRSTDPKGLLSIEDPVGPDNDERIFNEVAMSDGVICAWGSASPLVAKRAERVLAILRTAGVQPQYLKMNKDGQPSHPLYLGLDVQPQEWRI